MLFFERNPRYKGNVGGKKIIHHLRIRVMFARELDHVMGVMVNKAKQGEHKVIANIIDILRHHADWYFASLNPSPVPPPSPTPQSPAPPSPGPEPDMKIRDILNACVEFINLPHISEYLDESVSNKKTAGSTMNGLRKFIKDIERRNARNHPV